MRNFVASKKKGLNRLQEHMHTTVFISGCSALYVVAHTLTKVYSLKFALKSGDYEACYNMAMFDKD